MPTYLPVQLADLLPPGGRGAPMATRGEVIEELVRLDDEADVGAAWAAMRLSGAQAADLMRARALLGQPRSETVSAAVYEVSAEVVVGRSRALERVDLPADSRVKLCACDARRRGDDGFALPEDRVLVLGARAVGRTYDGVVCRRGYEHVYGPVEEVLWHEGHRAVFLHYAAAPIVVVDGAVRVVEVGR